MTLPRRPSDPDRATAARPDEYEERAARWEAFALLRLAIEQSTSSLRTEALIKLDQLKERVEAAEALGDA